MDQREMRPDEGAEGISKPMDNVPQQPEDGELVVHVASSENLQVKVVIDQGTAVRIEQNTGDEETEEVEGDPEHYRQLRQHGVYTPRALQKAVKAHDKRPYLIDGLVRPRSVNLIVGDSGLGKTPLMMQAGVCIATGLPFLGMHIGQRGAVLYSDAESDQHTFNETLWRISRFLGLSEPPPNFYVWSPNWEMRTGAFETYADWKTKLMYRVELVKPVAVFVDPTRMFFPVAEAGNDEAAKLIVSLRQLSGPSKVGCAWILSHHRRKPNNNLVGGVPLLDRDPHAWFREASGAHALVNQTDTRIGVVPHTGEADLLVSGFVRGSGPFVPLDVARVTDDDGTPIGYRLLTGVEHLSPEYREVFNKLPSRFRFKDVLAAMGGKSASNPTAFVKKCVSLGILKKDGHEYAKVTPGTESME
jgi:hypothetical protein